MPDIRIAIVGASSQIAKDLICSMSCQMQLSLLLYVRDIPSVESWVKSVELNKAMCTVHDYADYGQEPHDVVINFVGVGDPRRAAAMGASIIEVTRRFDDLVLEQLWLHPQRKYIFLSSGAAYGDVFDEPVDENTFARIDINNLKLQDFYSIAKLYAETKHRSCTELAITDIRVFNYFSNTQDINARFFIADIVRAIREEVPLRTTDEFIVRDFLHRDDFAQLFNCIIAAPPNNCTIDCYSKAPIDKPTLLAAMHTQFGLEYEIVSSGNVEIENATGIKPYYYSLNRRAKEIGYIPQYTSLECVINECKILLGKVKFNAK